MNKTDNKILKTHGFKGKYQVAKDRFTVFLGIIYSAFIGLIAFALFFLMIDDTVNLGLGGFFIFVFYSFPGIGLSIVSLIFASIFIDSSDDEKKRQSGLWYAIPGWICCLIVSLVTVDAISSPYYNMPANNAILVLTFSLGLFISGILFFSRIKKAPKI